MSACDCNCQEILMKELEDFIETTSKDNSALIEILHKAQNIFGYIPTAAQLLIGEKLNIPASSVYGVVSFYSYFTTEPKGKYVVSVCMGTACFVRKSDAVLREFENLLGIKAGETRQDGRYSIEALRCLGACGLAPVVKVNDDVYGKVSVNDIPGILEKYV